jgi:tetratricopeptide (TPR) repeat protein
MATKWLFGFVAAVFATVALAGELKLEPPSLRERWTKTTIDNIVIFSNAPDRIVRSIGDDLLIFRKTLSEVSKLETRASVPMYVFAFRGEVSFAPYRAAALGSGHENVQGIFMELPDANRVVMSADSGLDQVVYHELAHYSVQNTVVGAPPWVHEGLAEFYSTLSPLGGSRSVRLGLPEKALLAFLQDHGLMPLPELFRFSPMKHKTTEAVVEQFYAESWLLIHYFLIGNPKRGAGLGTFLSLLDHGESSLDAFDKAFGISMQELLAELNSYLRRGRYNAVAYTLTSGVGDVPQPREVGRDEILANLGDLLLHIAPEKAPAFLTDTIAINSHNALALADLAVLEFQKHHGDEAEKLYKQAVEAAGSDVRPLIAYGVKLVSDLQSRAADGERISASDISAVRQLALRAVELAPSDPNPYAILGLTYTFIGQDAAEGIRASEKSFRLAPARLDVAADLVLLYQIAGRTQLAQSMINRVIQAEGDQKLLQKAQENLILGEYVRGVNLMDAGKIAEGQSLLQKASETVTNPNLKHKIVTIVVTKSSH